MSKFNIQYFQLILKNHSLNIQYLRGNFSIGVYVDYWVQLIRKWKIKLNT